MAHFQVPDSKVFFNSESKLKSWPATATGHRFFTRGDSGEEKVGIQINQEITLEIAGANAKNISAITYSNPDTVDSDVSKIWDPIKIIKLKGKKGGTTIVKGIDSTGNMVAGPLSVVVGDFKKHTDMEIDLIADVCRGSDSFKILALQRMLHNNEDNVFNQNDASNFHADFGNMACGIVAKYRGDQIFGYMGKVDYDHPYHETLRSKVTDRNQVKYKPEKIQSLQTHIGEMLKKGQPVRVGVVDSPIGMTVVNGKLIAYFGGGHSVLIVGCDKQLLNFLYVDPWFNGSKMKYKGGIAGNEFSEECENIGIFEAAYDAKRSLKATDVRNNIVRQSSTSEGTFTYKDGNFLEVVAGPWRL